MPRTARAHRPCDGRTDRALPREPGPRPDCPSRTAQWRVTFGFRGFPAAPVKLTPVTRDRRAKSFIRRAVDRDDDGGGASPPASPNQPKPGSDDSKAHPSSNDDGAGKPVAPKQGELILHQQAEQPVRKMRKKGRSRAANDPDKMRLQRADQQGSKSKSAGSKAAVRGQGAGEVSPTSRPSMPLPAVIRAEAEEAEQSALAGQTANGKLAASQAQQQPLEKA